MLGAAVGFVLGGFAANNVSGNGSIVVVAIITLFGGALGSKLAGHAQKETESHKTPGFAKAIIWFLVIAIIVVAVIAFVGLNM